MKIFIGAGISKHFEANCWRSIFSSLQVDGPLRPQTRKHNVHNIWVQGNKTSRLWYFRKEKFRLNICWHSLLYGSRNTVRLCLSDRHPNRCLGYRYNIVLMSIWRCSIQGKESVGTKGLNKARLKIPFVSINFRGDSEFNFMAIKIQPSR